MNCFTPWVGSPHSFPANGKQKTGVHGSLCGDSLEISWYFTVFCLRVSVTCAEGTAEAGEFSGSFGREHAQGWCYPLSSSLGLGM